MTTATKQLNHALITLAATGNRPRCSDPVDHMLWTSETEADRATATAWCTGCQVLVLCGEAADERDERWGVWGGVDRSISKGRKGSVIDMLTELRRAEAQAKPHPYAVGEPEKLVWSVQQGTGEHLRTISKTQVFPRTSAKP